MAVSEIVKDLPPFLSYGVIGLGAIALLLFLFIGRQSTPIMTQFLYVILTLFVVATGGFLEWTKTIPVSERHVDSCTDSLGNFGQVRLKLDVLNDDLTSNGPTLSGLRTKNEPLIALVTLGFLADLIQTTSWRQKRFMASWECATVNSS